MRVEPRPVGIAKVAAAASVGSLVEWYDFFISGIAAAAIWPTVFFPSESFGAALALSIATYGIVFFVRPVGAFLFGHYGDRLGRKPVLVWTLLTTGVGTVGIALAPPFTSLGAAAPALLVAFRLVQGLGLGGEFGGASTWLAEVASTSRHRSFWTGWVQAAIPLGIALATLVYFVIGSSITHPALLAWGWRIPFLLGAVVLVVGALIRHALEDSPLFSSVARGNSVERAPAAAVLKKSWRKVLLLGAVSTPSAVVGNFVVLPYSVSIMVAQGLSPSTGSLLVGLSALVGAVWVISGAGLGDVIGRKRVIFMGTVFIMVGVYPAFLLVLTRNVSLIFLGLLLNGGEFLLPSVLAAFLPEQFRTTERYSGAGLSFQMGGFFTGFATSGVLPLTLVYFGGPLKAWPYVSAVTIAICLISLAALSSVKETKDENLRG